MQRGELNAFSILDESYNVASMSRYCDKKL